MDQQLKQIKDKIAEYKQRFFTKKLVNGIILLLSISLITFISISLLEHYGNFSPITRKVLFYSLLSILLIAAYFHLFIPVKNLINKNEAMSDAESSKQIGEYFPDIKDKLLNTLQLSQLNYSDNALILASINQKTVELQPFTFKNAIDFEESKKYLQYYLLLPFLLLISILIFNSKAIVQSSHRLVHYNKEFVPEAPFKFNLQNKSLKVFEGENLDIKLKLDGHTLPEDIYLVSNNTRYLMKNENGVFKHSFFNVRESNDFWFEAAGYNSKSHSIELLVRPNVEKIQVELEFPKYLNKTNTSSDNIGNLTVPEGTKITWKIQTKETESIKFVFNDSLSYTSERQKENEFQFKKQIKKNTHYSILLKNALANNKDKIQYSIESIEDRFPNINLEQYSDTLFYKYLLIGGAIGDDYGISQLKLSYRIENDKNKNDKASYINVPLTFNKNLTNQNFVFQLNIQEMKLKPGDKIEYFVTVYDNDGVNGAKASKSHKMQYAIPTTQEIEEKQDQESENNKSELADAIKKSEKINAELKKLSDQLKTKKELSWQDKKDIEKVLQKHRELQSEIQNLNQNIEQQNQQKDRFEQINPELAEKMKQLEELMKQMVDPETQKLMEELQKLMENKSNLAEINKKLEELNKKDDNFEKELDRALEMYKQMEFEQKLENNIDKLKDLSKKQEDLQKQTEKTNSKDELQKLQKEQEEIKKEFEELKKDMDDLNKINDELENKHDLENLNKDEKDIEQNMENSSEQMSKGNKQNASQSQENAAEKMKQMAKKMEEMKEKDDAQALEENIEDLKKIIDNLIKLSFKQEDVINKLSSVSNRDPLFLEYSQKQLNIESDATILQDSLYALAKRLLEVESIITDEVNALKDHLAQSSEFIKQRNSSKAFVKQQFAMTSMNNLALMLDDLLDNLQSQMSQKKNGDQMCQKPGNNKGGKSGKPKPSMGDMQKQLNDMIKQLQNGQKQGKSMSSELAKAAARQEMLRRGLQELQKGGTDGKENQQLSDEIKKMEKAMEETEKDLLNNKLSDKTIQRQQEILTRLLEAENASKERDFSEKRKATEAKSQSHDNVPNYDQYLKNKQKQIELLQTIPPTLSPYYKKEVNEYFETIDK